MTAAPAIQMLLSPAQQRSVERRRAILEYIAANPTLTWEEIGEHFGCSKQYCNRIFRQAARTASARYS
jgi:AraC-like DNA-binding protein